VAVAPGKDIFGVVATSTGDTSYPDPNIARNGFEVRVILSRSNRDRPRTAPETSLMPATGTAVTLAGADGS
jgi:hypothetical protein